MNNITLIDNPVNIFYDNYTLAITIEPTPLPSQLYLKENNDPTTYILGLVWVIIQIFAFFLFSFGIMCTISYISRVKLVREMRQRQGVSDV